MDAGIKNIADPDPRILRLQYAAKQRAGEFYPPTGCPHPVSSIEQAEDVTSYADRRGRPTNMFFCGICHIPLRLVAYDGIEPGDG